MGQARQATALPGSDMHVNLPRLMPYGQCGHGRTELGPHR